MVFDHFKEIYLCIKCMQEFSALIRKLKYHPRSNNIQMAKLKLFFPYAWIKRDFSAGKSHGWSKVKSVLHQQSNKGKKNVSTN